MTAGEAPARRWALFGLLIAAALPVVALAALMGPLRGSVEAIAARTPAGRTLSRQPRLAEPEPGFRVHVDPEQIYSVALPLHYEPEVADETGVRLKAPPDSGVEAYLLVAAERVASESSLDDIDAQRDERIRREAGIPFTRIASSQGELDGRPALNRVYDLGKYRAWEVIAVSGNDVVTLTFLCDAARFAEQELLFRKVFASFRFAEPPR